MPLSLKKNVTWSFSGNGVYAACQWGMLIAIAKLGNATMVGQFALGLAVTAPVILFFNLSLRSVQATDALRTYPFADYLGLRLLTTLLALLSIAAIVGVGRFPVETAWIILIIATAKAFEAVSDVYYGLLQREERMDRIAKSMMGRGLVSLAVLGTLMLTTGNLLMAVSGLALSWALMLLVYDIRSGTFLQKIGSGSAVSSFKPRWDFNLLKKLVWLVLPLGAVVGLTSLYLNIPRYFIENFHGQDTLGVFAAMAYFMVAGNLIINALGHSASPRLAKFYVAGQISAFWGLLWKMILISLGIGGLGILIVTFWGQEILTLFYGAEYGEEPLVFLVIMVGAALAYVSSLLGYGITAQRHFRNQLVLNIFSTLLIVAFSALWIPKGGMLGAAFALLAGFSAQILLKIFFVITFMKEKHRKTTDDVLDREEPGLKLETDG